MSRRVQLAAWAGIFVVFCLFLSVFSSILPPFIFGAAIAYLCDPLADRLEKLEISRLWSTIIVMACVTLVLTVIIVTVIPLLLVQLNQFIKDAPGYFNDLQRIFRGWLWNAGVNPADVGAQGEGKVAEKIRDTAKDLGVDVLQGVWSSGMALISTLGMLVITPVVAFYLLLDWDHLVARVDEWIPRKHVEEVRKIASDIDNVLSGFLRGQFMVCMIQGSFYAAALTLVGLDYGLFVGLAAGLFSFIPYVGSMLGLVLSVGLAMSQFWGDWFMILTVLGIFIFGQAVEGNILTPYLVGSSVGLHPVWLIFALSAFGSLFGFAGMLVAVPVAAAIGVLTRWGLDRYRESDLYLGD